MNSIHIDTTQNVELNFKLAGLGDRLLAYIIDFVVLIAVIITILVPTFFIVKHSSGATFFLFVYISVMVVVSLYDLLCEIFMDGQTVGKKARKIKVIRIDGSTPSFGNYFMRWIFRLIDISITFGGAAIISIIVTEKEQRLGDIAAGTTVIKLANETPFYETVFTNIEEDYNPVFSEADNLTAQQVEIIKEVLFHRPENNTHGIAYNEMIKKAAQKVQSGLNISTDMNNEKFLKTLLKDYNHFKGKIS